MTTKEFKREDGRKLDETREIKAEVGIIPNADGSAMFAFGDTIAIAAVYGPRQMYPQHQKNPEKSVLRCNYSMLSFSVNDRIRPGPNRRSMEISKITEWALEPVLMIEQFPNMVIDVYIAILQANASTRCAGINAAAMALAHAGIPMKDLVSSVSIGKLDKHLVVDLNKKEEDYEEGEGATDMPFAFFSNEDKITLMQLDGNISTKQYKEAIELAKKACKKIYEVQKEALKKTIGEGD
ncbi:MAG: exosome complex exonuclease Rrp41 [Nanoarchaeota archaeon]|nr:exosome complex exonuclease Rrp41 [Nanoarchaeota archaeon]